MTYYCKLGEIPHKRHTQFRQPDGTLYHEEVMGIHGFAGIQAILHYLRPPTAARQVESVIRPEIPYEDAGALRPRHLRSQSLPVGGDSISARLPLMGNQVEGDFMSRKGIERASFTFHPNGIPHGPHPGTYEGSIGKERTEEQAVMVDTFRPLRLTRYALERDRGRGLRLSLAAGHKRCGHEAVRAGPEAREN